MNLEQGQVITKLFRIANISVNERRAELTLEDSDGVNINGFLKDNISLFISTYSVGEYITCKGRIRKLESESCLDIIWISKSNTETEINEKFNLIYYKKRFFDIIDNIKDSDYKKILENCFNEDVSELFFSYPASKTEHHSYISGLLKHSIEVTETALLLAIYYKDVDIDLLSCAALLHDIGKLKSYDIDETTHAVLETSWEKELGHASMSTLFLSKVLQEDVEQNKALALYSLVLNHHSEHKSRESFILKKADELSIFLSKY